jgi:hypothetical protein
VAGAEPGPERMLKHMGIIGAALGTAVRSLSCTGSWCLDGAKAGEHLWGVGCRGICCPCWQLLRLLPAALLSGGGRPPQFMGSLSLVSVILTLWARLPGARRRRTEGARTSSAHTARRASATAGKEAAQRARIEPLAQRAGVLPELRRRSWVALSCTSHCSSGAVKPCFRRCEFSGICRAIQFFNGLRRCQDRHWPGSMMESWRRIGQAHVHQRRACLQTVPCWPHPPWAECRRKIDMVAGLRARDARQAG